MKNEVQKAVPIPFQLRFRLWRQRFLPLLVFIGTAGCVVLLLRHQTLSAEAIGMVELRSVAVAPLVDGMMHSLGVDVLDEVASGQIVALMDERLVSAEIAIAQAELDELRAALASEEARLDLENRIYTSDDQGERRRFAWDEEQTRLEHLDRIVEQESKQIELQQLEITLQQQRSLFEEGLVARAEYDTARLNFEALRTELNKSEAALSTARERVGEALERRDLREEEVLVATETEQILAPYKEALAVQESLLQEIQIRRKQLALRAPLAGQVTAILYRPGETVLSGAPLVTIADTGSNRVIAYLKGPLPNTDIEGSQVKIHSQSYPLRISTAKIAKVGKQVLPLPEALQSTRFTTQRGVTLLVDGIPPDVYRAGEIVTVQLKSW